MSATSQLADRCAEGVLIGRHTSLRVGGPARLYAENPDAALLAEILSAAVGEGWPVFVLGGGSNLLVADAGFDGVVLRYTATGHTLEAQSDGSLLVKAAAGTSLSNLARRLAREGLAGLEWAATVPGTVGGAVVNNAGAFGGCMAENVLDATLARPGSAPATIPGADLGYAYRDSVLKRGALGPVLVTSARLRVRRDEARLVTARIEELSARRSATQPRQLSAGSIFANPPGDYAGRLVEAAGLKGARRGGAEISGQHANFIVNTGGATARDVLALIRLAQDAVWAEHQIWLHPEVQPIGLWSADELAPLDGPRARNLSGAPEVAL